LKNSLIESMKEGFVIGLGDWAIGDFSKVVISTIGFSIRGTDFIFVFTFSTKGKVFFLSCFFDHVFLFC
jgi:nucleoside permease NupC